METVKIDSKRTLMVAHRGAGKVWTENSMKAFENSAKLSYYGLETDVHFTLDNVAVIMHDDETGRVGDLNLEVEKVNFSELKKVKLKDLETGEFSSELKIPEYYEYLRACKNGNKIAVIELKNEMNFLQTKEIYETAKIEYEIDKCVFISFSFQNLKYLREVDENCTVQFLTTEYNEPLIEILKSEKFDLDILYTQLTKERIEFCHERGIKVNCWTVDEKDVAELLVFWGVDYITSNILE